MVHTYSYSICESEFKNSRSLYSHKYKYHPKALKSAINQEVKRKKEYQLEHDSISNDSYPSSTNLQTDNYSQNLLDLHYNKSLPKFTKRLPKLFRIVGNIRDDVKELKKAVSDNQRYNISSVNGDNIKVLEEVNDIKKQNFPLNSEMAGSGNKDENRINELTDDVDHLFLKMMKLEGANKKKGYGIESMEKAFDNTLEMIELFRKNMFRYSDPAFAVLTKMCTSFENVHISAFLFF